MTRHDPQVALLHMRDFALKAVGMSKGKSKADLEQDELLRLALTHLVVLVGEAAGRVPQVFQENYPQIPWPKIISMRNRLIHGYDFIDYDILWEAITVNLPSLLAELQSILPPGK